VKRIVGKSQPHIVTEPSGAYDFYRKVQKSEGKLHEITELLKDEYSVDDIHEMWIRDEWHNGVKPTFVRVEDVLGFAR